MTEAVYMALAVGWAMAGTGAGLLGGLLLRRAMARRR